jgi:hypothetical protein
MMYIYDFYGQGRLRTVLTELEDKASQLDQLNIQVSSEIFHENFNPKNQF